MITLTEKVAFNGICQTCPVKPRIKEQEVDFF